MDLAVDLFPAVSPLGLAEQVLVVGVAAVVQAQVLVAGDGYSDVLHHLEEDQLGAEGLGVVVGDQQQFLGQEHRDDGCDRQYSQPPKIAMQLIVILTPINHRNDALGDTVLGLDRHHRGVVDQLVVVMDGGCYFSQRVLLL